MRGKGVFLYSKQLDSEFMVKCLQMLVNNFPDVKITSVESDEQHFGYRVHFSSPKENVVLARKQLTVSGKHVPIVPLRTYLTIHGIPKHGGQQFDRELCNAVRQKFGTMLHFYAVPNPENLITENIRARVDVPELEELKVFKHEGYPDMFVRLPRNNEMLRVTFYCRRCKSAGHVQQNCPFKTLKDEPCSDDSNSSYSRHLSSNDSEDEDDETSSNEGFAKHLQFSKGCSSSYNDMAGPSWRNSAPPPKTTTAVENTSPALQAYINIACKEFNIIDRNQLDAFFNCVKNRRNPLKIARNYTSNPRRLKTLLRKVIKLSHTTSYAATKEDKQFINWLKQLVKRFEKTIPKSSGKWKSSIPFF